MTDSDFVRRAMSRIARMKAVAEDLTQHLGLPPEAKYDVLTHLQGMENFADSQALSSQEGMLLDRGSEREAMQAIPGGTEIRRQIEQRLAAFRRQADRTGQLILAGMELLAHPQPSWMSLQPGVARSSGVQPDADQAPHRDPLDILLTPDDHAPASPVVLGGWWPEDQSQAMQLYLQVTRHEAAWHLILEALESGPEQVPWNRPWHVEVLVGDTPLPGHFEASDRWVADRPLSGLEAAQVVLVISLPEDVGTEPG